MSEGLDRLQELLDLEVLADDVFLGANAGQRPGRVFGGQVAAQAMRAALNTVEVDHRPHSMHAYFLRPGQPGVPIRFEVDRIRDGRSFTTRTVIASQGEEVIFNLSASFHKEEEGIEYQLPRLSDVPEPEDVADRTEMWGRLPTVDDDEDDGPAAAERAGMRARMRGFVRPFHMREMGPSEPDERGVHRSSRRVWIKADDELPDDPKLHACILTYISDMGVVSSARPPSSAGFGERMMGASLDHAVWFHRPIRADQWLLFDLHTVSSSNARGLVQGTMHSYEGVLGLSVAQEALIRPVSPERMGGR